MKLTMTLLALALAGCAYFPPSMSPELVAYCAPYMHVRHLPSYAARLGVEPRPPECYLNRAGRGGVDPSARWLRVHDVATGEVHHVFARPGDYVVK